MIEELAAIRFRVKEANPTVPRVRLSYGERILNQLAKTPLYVRRKNGKPEWSDVELARWFNQMLTPARQAERDREVLLAEVDRLRGMAVQEVPGASEVLPPPSPPPCPDSSR